jgi:hypothetical protein
LYAARVRLVEAIYPDIPPYLRHLIHTDPGLSTGFRQIKQNLRGDFGAPSSIGNVKSGEQGMANCEW